MVLMRESRDAHDREGLVLWVSGQCLPSWCLSIACLELFFGRLRETVQCLMIGSVDLCLMRAQESGTSIQLWSSRFCHEIAWEDEDLVSGGCRNHTDDPETGSVSGRVMIAWAALRF